MKQEVFDSLWKELDGSWDFEQPGEGHRERFERRLADSGLSGDIDLHGHGGGTNGFALRQLWIQRIAVACVVVLIGFGIYDSENNPVEQQVSRIAPEAGESAMYFTGILEKRIQELENAQTPQTAPMVQSALAEISTLEADYRKLERELLRGGNTKFLLRAMVTNFQTQIDLLNEVLVQIEEFKLLNTQKHEEYTL